MRISTKYRLQEAMHTNAASRFVSRVDKRFAAYNYHWWGFVSTLKKILRCFE